MVDISSISAVVAAIGVIVGVVFAVLELRNLVKIRQTDLMMRLYSSFTTKEFTEAFFKVINLEFKDYKDFVKRYGSAFSDSPANIAWWMVWAYFEGAGHLLYRRLIDVDLAYEFLPAFVVWEKMKPVVEGMRKQYNQPDWYEWFEYLYNEMKKREQRLQP
jgi:hypothetical protein